MTEVEITTPRGIRLSATLTEPVDSRGAVVVFVHSFLGDRNSGGHYQRLAASYQAAGYATLRFDFSGCGTSDDDIVTTANHVEDLRSVCSWLAERGFSRQVIHAHSFGATVALRARPQQVQTMILTSPVTGPMLFDWSEIFSPDQLHELEKLGFTRIPDDSDSPREVFVISRETLADLSLTKPDQILTGLTAPVLVIFDADDSSMDLLAHAQKRFTDLPPGSKIRVEHDKYFADLESDVHLGELAVQWATKYVDPKTPRSFH